MKIKDMADGAGRGGSIELLAPAGSEAAFNAAVHNGADAVYLGAGPHHARQFSGGFSEASFFACVEKARIAGIKVYLTLNTLLKQHELETAAAWAEQALQGGVDAVIVQDIGLARRLRLLHPDMILHASTQMSIHNVEGVLAARAAGFSRVVLARELSLEAIAFIRERTDMELEVFAHGALCVCYSGQCLMSSLIGNRSGNRGICAQPCRLPWKLSESGPEGYLLSMKDLMSLRLLPQLKAAGVSSLKMEGRMKSPEYVAVVTGIYRKYLDLLEKNGPLHYSVDPADEKELRQIFNRGGFTNRYLVGMHVKSSLEKKNGGNAVPDAESLVDTAHPKNLGVSAGTVLSWRFPYAEVKLSEDLALGDGLEIHKGGKGGSMAVSTILTAVMSGGKHEKQAFSGSTVLLGDVKEPVSAGDPVYRTSQKTQMQAASDTADHWQVHRVPIKMAFVLKTGEKALLTVEDGSGHIVSVQSETEIEAARERALTPDRIREQLGKTGDSPWCLLNVEIRTDGAGTMPVKEINAMRRSALDSLSELRAAVGRIKKSEGLFFAQATEVEFMDDPAYADRTRKTVSSLGEPDYKMKPHLPCGPERLALAFALPPEPEWLKQAQLAAFAEKIILMVPPVSQGTLAEMKSIFPGSVWIRTPSIMPDDRMDALLERLEPIRTDMAGLAAGNPGMLRLLRAWAPELPIMADTGMNLWNEEAIRQAAAWGADMALLSPELDAAALAEIRGSIIPVASWAYGRVPVMTAEHCPGSLQGPCNGRCGACGRKAGTLTDRAGARFPYIRDEVSGKTVLFHHRPLRWQENEWHPQVARLYAFITDETPGAAAGLVSSLLSG
jgi:U32 family peptidase